MFAFPLLLLCLASNINRSSGSNTLQFVPVEGGQLAQSSEFKALDSYLGHQLQLAGTEASLVVPRLSELVEALVSLGPENFAKLDAENDDAGRKFKSLLAAKDAQRLLKLARDFVAASRSCEDEALSFLVSLVLAADDQPEAAAAERRAKTTGRPANSSSFLDRYSRSLLDKCWRFHLDRRASQLVKSAGKMSAELFELVEELANKLANLQLLKKRRAQGSITINDQSLPNNKVDRVRSLKSIALLSPSGQQVFTVALRKRFAQIKSMLAGDNDDDDRDQREEGALKEASVETPPDELKGFFRENLVAPCNQLLARMRNQLQAIEASGKLYSKSTLRADLASQAVGNFEFLYMLEMNRICEQIVAKQASLMSQLKVN